MSAPKRFATFITETILSAFSYNVHDLGAESAEFSVISSVSMTSAFHTDNPRYVKIIQQTFQVSTYTRLHTNVYMYLQIYPSRSLSLATNG